MGCSDSNAMKVKSNNNYYVDTEEFNEKYFTMFEYDFSLTENQSIKKIYTEILMENNEPIIKTHKIFIIRNFFEKKTYIIQIELVGGKNPKKHLINQKISGTSIDKVTQYIEKYNDIFQIDAKDVYYYSQYIIDIYIKSEKDDQNKIKTLIMFYKKENNNVSFIYTDFKNLHFSRGAKSNIKPNGVIDLYNESQSRFEVDDIQQKYYHIK